MATSLDSFVKGIFPHVAGCPESLIIQTVRKACIRLCEDSLIWKDDIPAGDITINVDDYTITPPTNTRIVTIQSLLYDKKEITKKTEEWLDQNDPGWRDSSVGDPNIMVQYAPDRIKLNRLPEATIVGGLVARVVLKPTNDAAEVDDLIYNDWSDAIEHGALTYLMEMPGKKWSDIKLSVYHGKHFNFQIQRARARSTMGFSKQSTTAQIPAW